MGKRYERALGMIDPSRDYLPLPGMRLVRETATVSFDPTVDLAVRLGIDPRRADQMVRGSVSLPHGTGKPVRVAVVAEGSAASEASEAGADLVGADAVIAAIEAGNLDFDAMIATPDQMATLGRYGKVLGPKGLMPNPKTGTVTTDVAGAVAAAKGGKVDYRTDRQGNVHLILGKASFPAESLVENYGAVIEELLRARPSAAKGRYLRGVHVSTSQGPSISLDRNGTRSLWNEAPAA
jgi:large subunit ribosomal protein L1